MENLRFRGLPVAWLGVGAPDVVGPGIAALQAAVTQYGGAGITNPDGALQGLKDAGNAAVGTVGPAIDALSGGSPDVMKITHFAWMENAKLASLPMAKEKHVVDLPDTGVNDSVAATQDDVDAASKNVQNMIGFYQQAQRLAASKHYVTPSAASSVAPAAAKAAGVAPASRPASTGSATTTPTSSASSSSSGLDTTTWGAIVCGAAALVIVGVIVARRAA
jgi:hypothetical protein